MNPQRHIAANQVLDISMQHVFLWPHLWAQKPLTICAGNALLSCKLAENHPQMPILPNVFICKRYLRHPCLYFQTTLRTHTTRRLLAQTYHSNWQVNPWPAIPTSKTLCWCHLREQVWIQTESNDATHNF